MNRFKRYRSHFLWSLACFTAFALVSCTRSGNSETTLPETVDYNYHIRPILSDRCFKCHGPDVKQRKADLQLYSAEGAYHALKDNPKAHAIVPGHADQSEAYLRISTADTSMVMPPVSSNLSLTGFEIAMIKKWIDQGAK